MQSMKKKIAGLVIGALAGGAVTGAYVAHRRGKPSVPVEITLSESVSADFAGRVDELLKPYLATHPDVRVRVRFDPTPRGGVASAKEAHVALRAMTEEERRGESPKEAGTKGEAAKPPRPAPLFAADFVVLAYNRALVGAAPREWSQIVSIATDLKEKKRVAYGFALPDDPYVVLPFFAGSFWPAPSIDPEAAARDAFSLLSDIRFSHGLTPHACASECATHLFEEAKVPFVMIGEWRLPELRRALGDDLGVTAVPPLPATHAKLASASHVYGLFRAGDATDAEARAADDMVRYLSKDCRSQLFPVLGKVPYPFAATDDARGRAEAEVIAVASDQGADVSPARVARALGVLDPVWADFTEGTIGASVASARLSQAVKSAAD
jgi:ABC-type glycerol-3-phosphate transport system substrate-binding protein